MIQKYNSASTSINKFKIPKLARILSQEYIYSQQLNALDYGCGKYDNTKEYLKDFNIIVSSYDPFNRSEDENNISLAKNDYDIVLLSNVLNVIYEKEVRLQVLYDCYKHLTCGGSLYITVYEGDRTGVAKINEKRNSCQLNKKLKDYLLEVQAVFGVKEVSILHFKSGNVICAIKDVRIYD